MNCSDCKYNITTRLRLTKLIIEIPKSHKYQYFIQLFSIAAQHPFPSVLENLSKEIIDDLQIQEESSSIVSESLNTNMYPMLDICTVEIPKSEVFKGPPSDFPLIPIINFGSMDQFNHTGRIFVNASKNQYVLNRIQNLQNDNQLQNREYLTYCNIKRMYCN